MHAGMCKSQVGIITAGLFFFFNISFVYLEWFYCLIHLDWKNTEICNQKIRMYVPVDSLKEGVYIELLDFSQ